jgi:hypothetical protein
MLRRLCSARWLEREAARRVEECARSFVLRMQSQPCRQMQRPSRQLQALPTCTNALHRIDQHPAQLWAKTARRSG